MSGALTKDQQALVENNIGLIYGFLRKKRLPIEENFSTAALGICKAALTFNPERNASFSTFAYHCMFSEIWKEKRYKNALSRTPEKLDASLNFAIYGDEAVATLEDMLSDGTDFESEVIGNIVASKFLKSLEGRDKTLIELRMRGLAQREIGQAMGLSQVQVSRLLTKLKIKFMEECGSEVV